MALNDTFALGRSIRALAAVQGTFGTRPTVAATDSLMLMSPPRFEPEEERNYRLNPRNSRSHVETYVGNRTVKATLVSEILPRGGANPPDCRALLISGIGAETVGGTQVSYGLSGTQAMSMVWAEYEANESLSEAVDSLVVDEVKGSIVNGELPTIEFSGPCRRLVRTGRGALSGTAAAGTGALALGALEGYNFEADSMIVVGTLSPYRVTAIGSAALTITGTLSGTVASGAVVYPYTVFDESQTGGSPVPHVNIATTLGGTSIQFTAAEWSVKNNVKEVRTVGSQYVTDMIPGWRDVTGSLTFNARRSEIPFLMRSSQRGIAGVNPVGDLVITYGATASGSPRLTVTAQNVEFRWSALEMPEAEEGTFTLPWFALADSTTSENEFQIVWDSVP